MARPYTYRVRKKREAVLPAPHPEMERVKREAAERLSRELFEEMSECPENWVTALKEITDLDLQDLLQAEREEAPGSPVAVELRLRIRRRSREMAEAEVERELKGE